VTVARLTVLAAAIAVALVGTWRGTWAVGGSDSSCYALMAAAFARGQLQPTTAIDGAPWPEASRTFAPGGFVPSPVHTDAASPICTPGFSLLLAPLYVVGGRDAIFLLTPLAGALLVWLTFRLGHRLAGTSAGAAAAIVVAVTPVFVFQVVQPMNDVSVATVWMAVLVLAAQPRDHSGWIGALTGLALLIRPNLAPAAVVVGVWCLTGSIRSFLVFAAAAAPFVLIVAAFNDALYGHPLQSGYGSARDLFSPDHLVPNLRNYGRALFETQLGFPLLGGLALFVVPHDRRRLVWLALSVTAAMVAVYLFYQPFPEWWYLRFFLPVLPVMSVLAMAAVVYGTRRSGLVWPVVAILVGVAGSSEGMRQALDLQRLERRFRTVGEVVRDRLPGNAVFLTVWNSGSVRYHADREAILWDSMAPPALDSAVAWLASRGYEPFIIVEEWEEPLFRERFAGQSTLADLDWPPRYQIQPRVRIFQPGDRARYRAGEQVPTEHVR
jgi:hypothetical protein